MNAHKNSGLTTAGRALMVGRLEQGCSAQAAAGAVGASISTAFKWRRRHRLESERRLRERGSAPGPMFAHDAAAAAG